MYTLTSTAGLNTTAPTISQVGAVLAQHLHDLAPDGPVRWTITTPWGTPHTGKIRLNGLPDDGFIDEIVADVLDDLTATEANRHTTTRTS